MTDGCHHYFGGHVHIKCFMCTTSYTWREHGVNAASTRRARGEPVEAPRCGLGRERTLHTQINYLGDCGISGVARRRRARSGLDALTPHTHSRISFTSPK